MTPTIFDPTQVVLQTFATIIAVITMFGGLVVWIVKKASADRDKSDEAKERAAASQEKIHQGYQESMVKVAVAIDNQSKVFSEALDAHGATVKALDATVKAMDNRLNDVQKTAKCHAPKPKRGKPSPEQA